MGKADQISQNAANRDFSVVSHTATPVVKQAMKLASCLAKTLLKQDVTSNAWRDCTWLKIKECVSFQFYSGSPHNLGIITNTHMEHTVQRIRNDTLS